MAALYLFMKWLLTNERPTGLLWAAVWIDMVMSWIGGTLVIANWLQA